MPTTDFVQTIGGGLVLLPASVLSDIQFVVPPGPSVAYARDAGQWYSHAGGVFNSWKPIGLPTTIPGYPHKVTLSQQSLNFGVGTVTNLLANTYDQNANLLTGRSYTAVSSVPGVASVGTISGNVIPITAVAAGTCSITVTDSASGVATFCSVTVTASGSGSGGAGPNAPGGLTVLINTGAITVAPPGAGQGLAIGGATINNFSPAAKSSVGEWAGNLTLDGSGTGWDVNYNPTLTAANSPVRFGFGWSSSLIGTGTLYIYRTVSFSSNWTTAVSTGVKMGEPRTTVPGSGQGLSENHILYASYNSTGNPAILQAGMQLQGPNRQARNIFPTSATAGIITGGGTHTIEEILTPESSSGAGNGTYTCYTDNAQTIAVANCNWLYSGQQPGWTYFMVDPVYGGGGSNPPAAMFWRLVSIYVGIK